MMQLGPTIFTWLGQACFLITTMMGTHILVDPPNPQVGYAIKAHSVPASIVFVSHEHPDHNWTEAAANAGPLPPRIVQPFPLSPGTLEDTGTYTHKVGDQPTQRVKYIRISAFHDNANGTKSGPDTLTVIETGGLRILHMGDIGQFQLTSTQLKEIGRVDVLMIPVGGFYTVDGTQAAGLVKQLRPRVILPMHYGTPALNPDLREKLAPPAAFLAAMKAHAAVVHLSARSLKLSPGMLPATPTIYMLRYE
ncbi:MAG: MBL fold metallo-hydrolase [Armatimonadota bacterium]|nr:MBL fold metallo-hydrolase [Armatimonadota bacterium]